MLWFRPLVARDQFAVGVVAQGVGLVAGRRCWAETRLMLLMLRARVPSDGARGVLDLLGHAVAHGVQGEDARLAAVVAPAGQAVGGVVACS